MYTFADCGFAKYVLSYHYSEEMPSSGSRKKQTEYFDSFSDKFTGTVPACIYMYMYIYVHTCTYVTYVRIYTCMYVYNYVHIHIVLLL